MADIEKQFEAAVEVIRSMPKKGSYQPSYDTMLKFYGYFKQANKGPCNEPRPGFWDVVNKAKWDAWSSLGDITKQEAMECYVKELKMIMETMPDTEEMADFSIVLKTFYEVVYEPVGEEPPSILRIFKKPVLEEKVEKCNGYSGVEILKNEKDGSRDSKHIIQEQIQNSDIHLNGRYSNGHDYSTNDLHQQDNNGVAVLEKNAVVSGSHIKHEATPRQDIKASHTPSDNLFIVEVGPEKKGLSKDIDGSKHTPFQQGVHSGMPNNISANNDTLSAASEDSDEEFCDSIDPEHLVIIKSDSSTLNGINTELQDHVLSDSESNGDENEVSNHQRLTSTPFHRKPVHVTFDTDKKQSSKKDKNGVNHHNGGILKVKQAGSGYGGGDAKRSSQQQMDSRYPQSRQVSRLQDERGITGNEMRTSDALGHSDSDSDDTNHNCESCDSSGERDEVNERIMIALERIQHDMNRVLRRLESLEDVMAFRQEQIHSVNRYHRRDQSPWWSQYLPSKTVAFLALWPFVIHLIFYYLRKRKVRN